jgi:protein-export membrane protein SecD
MRSSYRWGIVIVALGLALWGLAPTLLDLADGSLDREVEAFDSQAVNWVMKNGQPLTLGLDLQGGLLLQYSVLTDQALQDKLDRMARDVEARLEARDTNSSFEVTHQEGEFVVRVEFDDPADRSVIDNDFMANYAGGAAAGGGGRSASFEKTQQGDNVVQLVMPEDYRNNFKDDAIEQAIDTIRNRVNSLGVTEPSITRRGQSDIVVQLPGLGKEDRARAKDLIGQTARLRFRLVDDEGTDQFFRQFQGQLPTSDFKMRRMGGYITVTHPNKEKLDEFLSPKTDDEHILGYEHQVRYKTDEQKEIDEEASFWRAHYIFSETRLTGERVQDARVSVDQQTQKPVVSLTLDRRGAQKFGDLTREHVDERFAIMLDDEVQSAPVINEPIPGGRAQISMGQLRSYSEIQKEAQDLVIVLRHGALQAPIELQYQTAVGPTLGQESIYSSSRALLVGSILIILFMLFYYRGSGVVSVIALLFNMVFILSALAGLGATLTLPGIAGIILTVGMAVDANVIIYERIREEIRAGRGAMSAVDEGFDKGVSAVVDANVTTGIAALVLMQYGTGPIRGFAVTLLIGIASTLFTAVFISRLLFDTWLSGKSESADLSI